MAGNDETPDDGGTGMEMQDLKKLLLRSRREKVNCAMAQGDAQSGGLGLILMDRAKPPKAVLSELKKQFPTARTPCFGKASIDMDLDPKQVTFQMNKRIPGLDRKVRKTLKGTGFTKVVIEVGGGDKDAEEG